MKRIEVVAAVIQQDNCYLATQRGYGEFQGMWEFPGGKIEAFEEADDALIREIQEELNLVIKPEHHFCTVNYAYPSFHLTMHCYLSSIVSGDLILNEHMSAQWLKESELDDVAWLPADVAVVEELKKWIKQVTLRV